MAHPVVRAASVAALLSLILLPAQASAHAALVSARPGPGDQLTESPHVLIAKFDQNLNPSRTSLQLRSAGGVVLANGGQPGSGPREFRLDLPELPPGEYKVFWTSFSSEDDELARGTYKFTILAATAAPTTTPTASIPAASPPPITPPPAAAGSPTPTATPRSPTDALLSPDETLVGLVIAAGSLIVAALVIWLSSRKPK